MLINTVILFIRDTLPVFLLASLLLSQPGVSLKSLLPVIISGLTLAGIVYLNLSTVSLMFEGAGLELMKCLSLAIAWFGLCWYLWPLQKRIPLTKWAALFVLGAGITLPSAIHFFIYSLAYWPNSADETSLMVGTIIGLGISLSLATLLYLILSPLRLIPLRRALLCIFCAGQVAPIALMLEQINYLPDQARLWDTSFIVQDESEYGHLLNVLFGYEATPSFSYLLIYFVALAIPLLIALRASEFPVTFFSARSA